MAEAPWASTCCNPFGKPKRSSKRNLCPVLSWMYEKLPSLTFGAKICNDCRKKIAKLPTPEPESETPVGLSEEAYASTYSLSGELCSPHESVESVNQCLIALGETLIVKKKLQQVKYPKENVKKVSSALKKKLLPERESSDSDQSEMIAQLKDKFENTTKRSEKVLVLTVLSKRWTIRKYNKNLEPLTTWFAKLRNL